MVIKSYNCVRIKEEQFFKNAENIGLKFWNEGLSKKAVKIYGNKEAVKYRQDNLLSIRVNEGRCRGVVIYSRMYAWY